MVSYIKRASNDMFKNPFFKFIFKNRVFLTSVRILVAAIFFYAIYLGYACPGKENIFTTAMFWGIFWPFFMVLSLPTFGRMFCGICPHGFLGKYITKYGLKKKMPKWLENRFIGVMLLFLGWWGVYYIFPGIYRTPLGSAVLFTVMTVVAFVTYFLFKDMSYCKYICPVGTALRGFGKLSFTWYGSYESACKSCKGFECAKSCPYGLSPFNFNKKESIGDCTLCMECADNCESIGFKFVKPGSAILKNFKPLKAEVWIYLLILAAIPMSMAFHHGLGRSKIADHMIWVKTAEFFKGFINFGSIDPVGLFAFLYAALFTIGSAALGLWIAAKIMNQDFKKVFYTLGYAFAPLFILASAAHALEGFFTRNYERIVEGFAWGLGMHIKVAPLAKRGDDWLMFFHMFKWIAVAWALYILYRRMAYIKADKIKKIIAYPFAALVIIFFVGVNLYRGYVIDTYGRKESPRMGHMSNARHGGGHSRYAAMRHRKSKLQKIRITQDDELYLTNRLPGVRMMGMMGRRDPNAVPNRDVYLVAGDLNSPKIPVNARGTFYVVDTEGNVKQVKPRRKRGLICVEFEVPKSGYYTTYFIEKFKSPQKELTKIAKFEFKRFDHGSDEVYDKDKMRAKTIKEVPFDILRLRDDDETFYSRFQTGQEVKFQVLKEGKPVEGAKVVLKTQFGWQNVKYSDKKGIVIFKLVKDYYPPVDKFNKRFREKFIVTANIKDEGKEYDVTYTGTYMPSRDEYQSYEYGLLITIILLLALSFGVYLYRMRVQKPFKEVRLDEQD